MVKIVNDAIINGKISADDKRNCIFYNEDKTYAFLRSTGISNFIVYRYNNDNPLFIFESVIDILSYIDINNDIYGKWIFKLELKTINRGYYYSSFYFTIKYL